MKRKLLVNIIIFIASLFSLQVGIGYLVIQQSSITQMRYNLSNLTARVQHDLTLENGKWNTELYLSDPNTPHPNGSSGFLTPLYIVTTEGFVIERNLPITGLLDSSDFKHLMAFQKPQFVEGATNERWRVLSKPLTYNSETVGVITVSSYNPLGNVTEVDTTLAENIERLESKLSFKNNTIDITQIDIRNIQYDVSFEIVSRFNKVLINNGRTPTFVDPSYIYDELKNTERIVRDTVTQEPFLVHSQALVDKENAVRGLVVTATSMSQLGSVLKNYLVLSIFFNLLILFPVSLMTLSLVRSKFKLFAKSPIVKQISFNKKESYLLIDKKRIDIPYATNQYYLCEALFSSPQKRWEADELLDRFGEEVKPGSSRKIYDTAIAVNKKLGFKLVDCQEKTYRINPSLLSKLA